VTAFCLDHLHRLPDEVHVPTSRLIGAMVAYGVIAAERQAAWEEERERAARGF